MLSRVVVMLAARSGAGPHFVAVRPGGKGARTFTLEPGPRFALASPRGERPLQRKTEVVGIERPRNFLHRRRIEGIPRDVEGECHGIRIPV